MRAFFAYVLVVALALCWLMEFGFVIAYGGAVIHEPNRMILFIEIAVLLWCVIFGIAGIVRFLRGK